MFLEVTQERAKSLKCPYSAAVITVMFVFADNPTKTHQLHEFLMIFGKIWTHHTFVHLPTKQCYYCTRPAESITD